MQGWRALAIGKDGKEHLLFVGMSYEQVKKNYALAFSDFLTEEEQSNIQTIQMQRWAGIPDRGKWVSQDIARIPEITKSKEGVTNELQQVP
jgi:DNA polymerase/3'-5' exonuclease PolX